MDIKKSRIYELWNKEHSKVIKYKQILRNKTLNEFIEIEGEDLNELIKAVRIQLKKWNDVS